MKTEELQELAKLYGSKWRGHEGQLREQGFVDGMVIAGCLIELIEEAKEHDPHALQALRDKIQSL